MLSRGQDGTNLVKHFSYLIISKLYKERIFLILLSSFNFKDFVHEADGSSLGRSKQVSWKV